MKPPITNKMTKKDKNIPARHGKIVICTTADKEARLDVELEQDTVGLSQKQISELFKTERSVITKHLNTIFKNNELVKERNVQKIHIPFSDKPVSFYNPDVIISLGYRVNSKRATQFRIWATNVLRDHIVKGYTLNEKRLTDHQQTRLKELEKARSV